MQVNRVIRVPEQIIELANLKAKSLGVSTNKYIISLLEKDLSNYEQELFLQFNEQQITIEEIKNNFQMSIIEIMNNQREILKKLNQIESRKEENE